MHLSQVATATALHVPSCQDEFRQQQIAMLWRASGATHIQVTKHTHTFMYCFVIAIFTRSSPCLQRHLVCGPVKTPGSHLTAAQYLQ